MEHYSIFLLLTFLCIGSFLAGQVIHKTNRYLLIAIVSLTIPTTIFTLKDVYIPVRPPAMLSKDKKSFRSVISFQRTTRSRLNSTILTKLIQMQR